MANDRSAGRKQKYKFPTKTITFRVPSDVEELCRKSLKEIISTKAALFGTIEVDKDVIPVPELGEAIIRTLNTSESTHDNPLSKKCDCFLDGTIMKRGKSKPKCTLTKAQHKF